MSMNVQFLKGQSSKFNAEDFSPVSTTFYFLEDANKLYLGSILLSNEVSAEQFADLVEKVSTLETADFQSQINAILETLKSIATNDTVQAIDERLAEVEKDYLTSEDKTELEGKVTAHETAVNTKFNDYSTTEQMNAAIDADVKVVTDYITNHEEAWLEKYDDTVLAGRVTAVEVVADAAQTAQEVSDAIDAKISTYNTELDLANKLSKADSDAQGYASAAETNAKGYADQKLLDFENAYIKADENDTIDKLNEIAAWISDDEAGATKIISDVATNAANIKTINESAVMTSGITATKVGEYDTIKNTVDTNKSTWNDVVNKLDASTYNTFVGTTYATLDAAVAAANSHADSKDVDIAKGVDAQGRVATLEGKVDVEKVSTAISKATEDMATNASVDTKLADYTKTAELGTASAKHVEFFATAAQGEAGVAAKAVTDTLKSAAFAETTAFDVAGAAAAVQGTTTNTVKDCVDAINAMNNKTGEVTENVQNIVAQLTGGSF